MQVVFKIVREPPDSVPQHNQDKRHKQDEHGMLFKST